ncbi:mitochondrial carrier domain-containing protein [Kalaharituber pfeilii]|nr:mitochondrial carrier domain-containing protein [Kalaharituber pfeilii]
MSSESFEEDPTDFEGFSQPSLLLSGTEQQVVKSPGNNLVHGTSAAGARAICTQLIAFYFRAPVKAFLKMRVDYMHVARAINPRVQANERWSLRMSMPGLLAHAVKHYGWGFIPNQVLPPLVANASVGAILYTSYLTFLSAFHEPSSHSTKRVYPPPPFTYTLAAGMFAGGVQSLVAAPLDALQTRFDVNEMLEGRHRNMWGYAAHKLREIGVRGVFAGFGLSLAKESLGYGIFFASFEFVKQQIYLWYLTLYYGRRRFLDSVPMLQSKFNDDPASRIVIRPHYALEPAFLLLAGVTASVTQQVVSYPIGHIQSVHYGRLESLDYKTKLEVGEFQRTSSVAGNVISRWQRLHSAYAHSYGETFEQCKIQAKHAGSWRRWLYRGFILSTLRQVPSTSAGLIAFELFRRKFALDGGKGATIEHEGYDILLT